MTVRLHAFECGRLEIPHAFLLEGATGKITVPIPSYLIVHPKGRVLFDTGLNLATQTDPESYITSVGMRFNKFFFSPGEEISSRIESADVAPDRVDLIVNSHLHYDHAGGNALLPNADILIQEPEWKHACTRPDEDVAYRKIDFETGQKVRTIKGEHDLFGDGSVVAFPTYGHTPGHQSLRVRTGGTEFILCGDACYLRHALDNDHLPGVLHDREAALRAFALIRKHEAAGARVLFGHDPEFWKTIPQAPARLG
ncbi:MAG: N-acyl homoserine lactonase family protein [bacterium]|nr:N-acyl homoserine lactonase family protein [bacterium]